MMKSSIAILGGLLLVVPTVFVGCSGSEGGSGGEGGSFNADGDDDGGGSTKTGGTGKGSSGNGDTTSSEGTSGNNTTSGGGDCGSAADYEACETCICESNLAGCEAYWELEGDACACGAGAPCEEACANACTNDVEDPACDACYETLAEGEACFQASADACSADPDCAAYLEASTTCEALGEGEEEEEEG